MLAISAEIAKQPPGEGRAKRRLYSRRTRLKAQASADSHAEYLEQDYQATVSVPNVEIDVA